MRTIKSTPAENADIIPNCATCRFGIPDRIPDPSFDWKAGMGAKPKVDGFRCHAMRPSAQGFPIVVGDTFCAFFTERGTNAQPLRHLVSERSDV